MYTITTVSLLSVKWDCCRSSLLTICTGAQVIFHVFSLEHGQFLDFITMLGLLENLVCPLSFLIFWLCGSMGASIDGNNNCLCSLLLAKTSDWYLLPLWSVLAPIWSSELSHMKCMSFTSISERSSPCSRESITSELRLPVSCIYSTSNGRKIPLNKYTDFEMFLNGHGPHRHSAEAMTSTKQKNVCSCIRTMPMLSPVQRTHTQSSLCWVINEWNMLLALTKWDIFGRVNAIFAPGPWLRTSIDSRFFSCTFSIYSRRSVMANAMDKNWI